MKKLVISLCLAIIALSVNARVFTYDGLEYKVIDEAQATCENYGKGYISEFSNLPSGDIVIPETVSDGNKEYTVVAVGDYAFMDCSRITSVSIPATVKRIGRSAFFACESLTSFNIPEAVTSIEQGAFCCCSKLKSIVIPESVTYIGEYAFEQSGLVTAILPKSLKSLPVRLFSHCSSLLDVKFPENLDSIGERAFYYSALKDGITIPQSVRYIGAYSFSQTKLTSVTVPDGVLKIDNNAFADNHYLISVSIGKSLKTIGKGAFGGCNELTKVELGNSVDSIQSHAFATCEKLTDVSFGSSVRVIDNYAFQECPALQRILLPESVTYLGTFAFNKCTGLTHIDLPKNLTELRANTFNSCTSLKYITIPGNVTSIGEACFSGCKSLANVVLPEKLTELGKELFLNCTSLTKLAFPTSLTSVGTDAFKGCTSLKEVMVPSLASWLGISFAGPADNPFSLNASLMIAGEPLKSDITIPDGITELKAYSFINCPTLVNVTLSSSLKNVGDQVFKGCKNIEKFIFPSLESYLGVAYSSQNSLLTTGNNGTITFVDGDPGRQNPFIIPETVTAIPPMAFYGWTSLVDVQIPSTVTSIGQSAFHNCSNLVSVNIPENVTALETNVFAYCSKLNSLSIPRGVTTIGTGAFIGCTGLSEVELPEKLTKIGQNAFFGCSALRSINVPESIDSIGSGAFNYCSGLTEVNVHDANKWSGIVFEDSGSNPLAVAGNFCVNGKIVNHLDVEVDEVGDNAFNNATSLQTARVKGTAIGESSFSGAKNMTEACIDVLKVGNNAFKGCFNLKIVYAMSTVPPKASDNSFSIYNGAKLYVPVGSATLYKSAKACWNRFSDIVETDFAGIDEKFKADYTNDVVDLSVGVENVYPVVVADGCLTVTGAENVAVTVHSISGSTIYIGKGCDRLHLAPGYYLVMVDGCQATKIVVR